METIRKELDAATHDSGVDALVRPLAEQTAASWGAIQKEHAETLLGLLQVDSIETLLTLLLTARRATGFGVPAAPGDSLWAAYWTALSHEQPEQAQAFVERFGPAFLSEVLAAVAARGATAPASAASTGLRQLIVAYHNDWISRFPDSAEIFLERLVALTVP